MHEIDGFSILHCVKQCIFGLAVFITKASLQFHHLQVIDLGRIHKQRCKVSDGCVMSQKRANERGLSAKPATS